MEARDHVDILNKSSAMKTDEETQAFIEAIEALKRSRPPVDLLPSLLSAFDDATEHEDVMWSLVHLVEDYDLKTYVTVLIEVISQLRQYAEEWLQRLFIRVLNSDQAIAELRDILPQLTPSQRVAIAEVLKEISEDLPTEFLGNALRLKVTIDLFLSELEKIANEKHNSPFDRLV
jgi:uncharacterized protein YjgD (DUF1641 family)